MPLNAQGSRWQICTPSVHCYLWHPFVHISFCALECLPILHLPAESTPASRKALSFLCSGLRFLPNPPPPHHPPCRPPGQPSLASIVLIPPSSYCFLDCLPIRPCAPWGFIIHSLSKWMHSLCIEWMNEWMSDERMNPGLEHRIQNPTSYTILSFTIAFVSCKTATFNS